MTLREYNDLAMRTSPNDGHDKRDNGILGLIGETGELVDVYKKWVYQSVKGTPMPVARFIDEGGDVLWYLAELESGIAQYGTQLVADDVFDVMDNVAIRTAHVPQFHNLLIDLARHARDITGCADDDQMRHMRHMYLCLAMLARRCNCTLEDMAARNIAKLKARYPDGFDARISMQRYE